MKLRLMLKGPSRLMGAIAEMTFDSGGIIIGRAPEADWTIPDPDRVISKAHCRIDKSDRGYLVTDTSTNGVRINDVPVGRDMPALLSSGDTLTLGDAIIGVDIETAIPATQQTAAEPIGLAPMVAPPVVLAPPPVEGASDPFMEGPFGFDTMAASVPGEARPVVQQPATDTSKGQILQDWWNPSAASGKPGLTLSDGIVPENARSTNVVAGGDQGRTPPDIGGAETLLKAAEGIDAQALMRAVETAVLILSEDERQRFDRRLRELLRGETSRWK